MTNHNSVEFWIHAFSVPFEFAVGGLVGGLGFDICMFVFVWLETCYSGEWVLFYVIRFMSFVLLLPWLEVCFSE